MVKIRLARIGRKYLPAYRIVVSDSRRTPRGASVTQLGSYDPIHDTIDIDAEVALEWLNKGAIPSDSVKTLLKRKGIYAQFINAKVEAGKGKKAPAKKTKKSAKKLAKQAAKKEQKAKQAEAAKKEEEYLASKKATEPTAEPAADATEAK